VEFRKKMHMEELCALDRLEEQRGLTPEEMWGHQRSGEFYFTGGD